MKKFTKENFKEWLSSKAPRTKVGYSDPYGTPIYKFLKQEGIKVYRKGFPKWAVTFQKKVISRNDHSISAMAALALLR